MEDSRAVELLRENPRVFWGNVIRLLIERGWSPPRPDERIVDDLIAGMQIVDVPNAIGDLREAVRLADPRLTPKETKVMTLVSLGMSTEEVATELGVALGTVKFHLANVYRKLGAKSRGHAVAILLAEEE